MLFDENGDGRGVEEGDLHKQLQVMNFIARITTTLFVLPTTFGGVANADIINYGCETFTSAEKQIGEYRLCTKEDTKKPGNYLLGYKDATFQGVMAAYCAENATGYRAYFGADETQVMHITRGFCNGLRTENGVARTMETFSF